MRSYGLVYLSEIYRYVIILTFNHRLQASKTNRKSTRTHFVAPCLDNEHKINLFRMLPGCRKTAFYTFGSEAAVDRWGERAQIASPARATPPELPQRVTWNERDGWRRRHANESGARKKALAACHHSHQHPSLLTTAMSRRRPPRGAICSCSSRFIWDVKLRHLNKSLLPFLAPAKRKTRSSKMSTGKKAELT